MPATRPAPQASEQPLPVLVKNHGLFSSHYLTKRLPTLPEWREDISGAVDQLKSLYAARHVTANTWNEAQTESEFIRPALDALGWEYIVQVTYTKRGRQNIPDYALFADTRTKEAAYSLQDGPGQFYARALAICDAKYWGRALDAESRNDPRDALTNANPSFQIINYLVGTDVAWGILTNGKVWRLYAQRVRSRITTFLEIDLAGALDADDLATLRYFLLFFRRAAFQIRPAARKSFLDDVLDESAGYAVTVQDELKELVFERVAPLIVQGFVAWRRDEHGIKDETPETLAEIYKAALVLLYRLLFLFYAEARNLLPVQDERGYGQLSLARISRHVADQKDKGSAFGERITLLWDALKNLFRIVTKGDAQLHVPVYNGGLFDDRPRNGTLSLRDLTLADTHLAEAIDLLARRQDPTTGQPVFIDYQDLDVRHLGSIYEGLLEFQPRVAEVNLALIREKGREAYVPAKNQPVKVRKGEVYLANDKGQRKSTGSYYTPDYIVKHIVTQTLGPILTGREARFRAAMEKINALRRKLAREDNPARNRLLQEERSKLEAEAVAALLDVKVCDPAMGSGHFLVETVGYLTDHFAALLAEYPANPLVAMIENVREQIRENLHAQGIEPDPSHLDDKHLLKRMVMKRCIYGVDLNLMAVELAKLALWLDSFTVGAPLSFLNHHLKHGNSLVGTRAEAVQSALTVVETKVRSVKDRKVVNGLQGDLFGSPFAGLLTATALMRDVAILTDATSEEVEQSAEKYAAFEREMLPYKRVLDIWVSRHFGIKHAESFLRLYGNEALRAVVNDASRLSPEYRAAIAQTQTLWRVKRFFHWDLEFPEVFIDLTQSDWKENPGFDAVVSNPPYVDVTADNYYRDALQCASAGNLYAYMLEVSGRFLARGGRTGMIVPLSLVCSERMAGLRAWCLENFSAVSAANFGIRPAKIFPNVDQRVTILFADKPVESQTQRGRLLATRFHRWQEGQELHMIANLRHVDITHVPQDLGWPKLGDETGLAIACKLFAQKSRVGDHLGSGKWRFFYHGIGRYWLKAYNFEPTYLKADGQPGRSTTLFELTASSAEIGHVILAILNSSLFFWFWVLYGDDFHLMPEQIATFPFTHNKRHQPIYAKLKRLVVALMRDYKKHSILKRGRYPTGEITWQEFYPRRSKAIIDQIDDLLGMIYGLRRKEVEYIKTYDLEFRTDEEDE
jgi:hypothetical protein